MPHRPHPDTEALELLRLIHAHQHTILERLNKMADDTDARLDTLESRLSEVGDAITAEIQQLANAKPGLTPEQAARIDASIARLTTMRDALKADDAPTPPAPQV